MRVCVDFVAKQLMPHHLKILGASWPDPSPPAQALFLTLVRIEEALLRARYGRGYEAYCGHVPHWIRRGTAWKP